MKKALLTIACALMAFAVSAQEDGGKKFVVSGTIGIGATSETYSLDGTKYAFNNTATPSTFNLTIMPKFGYQINENLQVGVSLGYIYMSNTTKTWTVGKPEELATTTKQSAGVFEIGVYGRYNVAKINNFTVFGELQLGFGFGSGKTLNTVETPKTENTWADLSYFMFNAALIPGINYAFSDSFSMDLYLNVFGLSYSMVQTTDHMAGVTADKDAVTTTHDFGLNCDLQNRTIDNFTAAIAVGFNYHF